MDGVILPLLNCAIQTQVQALSLAEGRLVRPLAVSPVMSYIRRMRLVLDTNIVVSGLRSPSGASAALLDRALSRVFTLLLSVALALEYEASAKDSEQLIASGLSEAEVATVLASLCAVAEPVYCWFLWRPQLRDPADEMVLETAINGVADGVVTFNRRHFASAAKRFGIPVLWSENGGHHALPHAPFSWSSVSRSDRADSPQQALRRMSD